MTRFPPHTAVLSTVKMTRTAYAQLVGQKFFAPKIFGSWKEPEGSKEWRWRDVGLKIVCCSVLAMICCLFTIFRPSDSRCSIKRAKVEDMRLNRQLNRTLRPYVCSVPESRYLPTSFIRPRPRKRLCSVILTTRNTSRT